MYFIILNTNDEQFILTTKKTLHLIFKTCVAMKFVDDDDDDIDLLLTDSFTSISH